jgi:hypothetical protein
MAEIDRLTGINAAVFVGGPSSEIAGTPPISAGDRIPGISSIKPNAPRKFVTSVATGDVAEINSEIAGDLNFTAEQYVLDDDGVTDPILVPQSAAVKIYVYRVTDGTLVRSGWYKVSGSENIPANNLVTRALTFAYVGSI